MAEKLLTRSNLAGKPVYAGDILEARIDGAMVHYHASEPMHQLAIEAGFKDGLPRVWDPERIFVLDPARGCAPGHQDLSRCGTRHRPPNDG